MFDCGGAIPMQTSASAYIHTGPGSTLYPLDACNASLRMPFRSFILLTPLRRALGPVARRDL